MHRQPPYNISDLMTKIQESVVTIVKHTLENVFKNMKICICFLFREGGGRFEHLQNWKPPDFKYFKTRQYALKINKFANL